MLSLRQRLQSATYMKEQLATPSVGCRKNSRLRQISQRAQRVRVEPLAHRHRSSAWVWSSEVALLDSKSAKNRQIRYFSRNFRVKSKSQSQIRIISKPKMSPVQLIIKCPLSTKSRLNSHRVQIVANVVERSKMFVRHLTELRGLLHRSRLLLMATRNLIRLTILPQLWRVKVIILCLLARKGLLVALWRSN